MAWIFQKSATPNDAVNLSPATGAELVFFLQQALKQAGWVVQSWSDGSTMSATNTGWTHGGSGAGGSANSNAWIRIRSPEGAGGRELTFQRGTTNLVWRHKISHSVGFTTGGTASQTPSASDQAIVAGGGTDASPTFHSWLSTDATYKAHIGTDNAAPYNAYCFIVPNGGGLTRHWWFINMSTGSYPSGDVAPYIIDLNNAAATDEEFAANTTAGSDGIGQGYYKKGISGESFRIFRGLTYNAVTTVVLPQGIGANPYDGDDNILPIPVSRVANGIDPDPGWKGFCPTDMLGWPSSTRNDGDFADVGGARYVYFDDIALRWPPGVIPAL
jgi:hypothetical protein